MQKRFERYVVCPVLVVDDAGFEAWVTGTGTATSGEYRYLYEADRA